MGNCSSCVPSHIQVNDYGSQDNALHFPAANSIHKVGSVHSHQGEKGVNQDAALLYEGYGTEDTIFCAVFDGHGAHGHIVSKVVRNQLPLLLLHQKKLQEWDEACVATFNAIDKEVELLDHFDHSLSGSTAVVVIKQGQDLVIANLGDSRAVLGTLTENGIQAIRLTVDLKPGLPAETERIERSNGRVFAHSTEPHIQRVWLPHIDRPGLAMSRAFGDFSMKKYGIIATPDVSQRRLTPEDQFLVLASDGVWDVLSDEEVVSIVSSTENKETAAKAVIDEALAAWKRRFPTAKVDDCSVVCLFLQNREDNLLPVNN